MHCALTGVQVLVTRTPEHAHWLANFCWGLLIVTEEKGKTTEISYSDARSLVTFSRGFILWQQGTCFYVWLWNKRERTSIHSAIGLILPLVQIRDALSITYKLVTPKHLGGSTKTVANCVPAKRIKFEYSIIRRGISGNLHLRIR
jgi:hypothetical protein